MASTLVPQWLDLTIYQGVDYEETLLWETDTPFAPVNLTGYTARLQIRARRGSPDALITLTNGGGLTLGGAAGTVVVALTAEQTETLTPQANGQKHAWDLRLVSPTGKRQRPVEGDITISPRVTAPS